MGFQIGKLVSPVLVQAGTDVVVDGHMRVTLALRDNIATIPVIYLDLDDNEVNTILATFDPISALAATDAAQLDSLLREVSTSDAAVMQMLADLASKEGVVPPDFEPVGMDAQGALDRKQMHTCPECGHVF